MSAVQAPESAAAALDGALRESRARHVLLAVSGGSDSLALLRLAARCEAGASFAAATVDHGLRPQSAEEALWVGAQCAEAGVEHVILRWTDEKPTTALQELARLARYRLLITEAAARGCDAVATAHTADDQAETVFMRMARGSAPRGLAGMAERSMVAVAAGEPIQLLRPLLSIPRQRLREDLLSAGRRWIDDPSNDDPRFERIRVRGLLAALEAQSLLSRDALLTTASRMRAAVERQDLADRADFDRHEGVFDSLGFARLRSSTRIPPTLIARLIRAVGAGDHPPSEPDAAQALDTALSTGASTLGGAMLRTKGEALYLCREAGALLGRSGTPPLDPIAVEAGASLLWDRRFILRNGGQLPVAVRPLGCRPESLGRMSALHRCPPEVLAAAPESGDGPGLTVQSLLPERFDGKVMRFS